MIQCGCSREKGGRIGLQSSPRSISCPLRKSAGRQSQLGECRERFLLLSDVQHPGSRLSTEQQELPRCFQELREEGKGHIPNHLDLVPPPSSGLHNLLRH